MLELNPLTSLQPDSSSPNDMVPSLVEMLGLGHLPSIIVVLLFCYLVWCGAWGLLAVIYVPPFWFSLWWGAWMMAEEDGQALHSDHQ